VASPGRCPGRAVEDGVLACLWGILAPGAGGGGIAVPRGMGAEVTLPRSDLVQSTRGEFV